MKEIANLLHVTVTLMKKMKNSMLMKDFYANTFLKINGKMQKMLSMMKRLTEKTKIETQKSTSTKQSTILDSKKRMLRQSLPMQEKPKTLFVGKIAKEKNKEIERRKDKKNLKRRNKKRSTRSVR